MSNPNSQTLELEDIDTFLPIPGAESVATADEKPNIFSRNTAVDMSFLDKEEENEVVVDDEKKNEETTEKKKDEPVIPIDDIIGDAIVNTDTEANKKSDKNDLVKTFSKLIEKGTITPFDDDKKLEEYSLKDWEELIAENIKAKENAIREQTPKEFFEALPDELQIAAKYVAEGGSDLKGLFRGLAQMEEVKALDPKADSHQIVRQYLRATKFGNDTEIEAQIQEWEEFNSLEKKAVAFKPKIEKMEQEIIDETLRRQEYNRKSQQLAAKNYVDNVFKTLEPGELNGIKLDKKTQNFLFNEMTDAKYQSITGKQTNLLGHLLEKYQFVEPNYSLVAEALWLLADPDKYKEQIRAQAKKEVVQDTVRKLKTEADRRVSNAEQNEEKDNATRKPKLTRPSTNFFSR